MDIERKNVSPEVIAAAFVKSLTSKVGQDRLKKMLKYTPEEKKEKVAFELKLLRAVAKLFIIYQKLGPTPEGNSIRDAFLAFLEQDSNSIFGVSSDVLLPTIRNRFKAYMGAWETPHHLGPFWMIGKKYAEFVDSPLSFIAVYKGSIVFEADLKFSPLEGILKEFKIKRGAK